VRPAASTRPTPEPDAPIPNKPSFKAAKEAVDAAGASRPAPPEPATVDPEPEQLVEAPAEATPTGDVDIDDVIVAWAEIQSGLPPATKAAVSEAQPISVDHGVITFGVPRARYDSALPRFRKEADNIRTALSQKLGRRMMFKPVAHDGFDADPSPAKETLDEEPPDDDETIDLHDLVDGDAGPAVDSVSLITQTLGATVVEEVPRD
jgi:hypothetical protein